MIDTMKLVSKLFMLSAVTLLGFTSALDSIGKNCLDENTDLNTEKWDTNRLPVNETSQTGVDAPENSRIPVLISDIDEVIDSITDDRLTDQMDANETILRENDFAQSISKITSPAMSNSRCFSGVCGPITENQRLLVSVIIWQAEKNLTKVKFCYFFSVPISAILSSKFFFAKRGVLTSFFSMG